MGISEPSIVHFAKRTGTQGVSAQRACKHVKRGHMYRGPVLFAVNKTYPQQIDGARSIRKAGR